MNGNRNTLAALLLGLAAGPAVQGWMVWRPDRVLLSAALVVVVGTVRPYRLVNLARGWTRQARTWLADRRAARTTRPEPPYIDPATVRRSNTQLSA